MVLDPVCPPPPPLAPIPVSCLPFPVLMDGFLDRASGFYWVASLFFGNKFPFALFPVSPESGTFLFFLPLKVWPTFDPYIMLLVFFRFLCLSAASFFPLDNAPSSRSRWFWGGGSFLCSSPLLSFPLSGWCGPPFLVTEGFFLAFGSVFLISVF